MGTYAHSLLFSAKGSTCVVSMCKFPRSRPRLYAERRPIFYARRGHADEVLRYNLCFRSPRSLLRTMTKEARSSHIGYPTRGPSIIHRSYVRTRV